VQVTGLLFEFCLCWENKALFPVYAILDHRLSGKGVCALNGTVGCLV